MKPHRENIAAYDTYEPETELPPKTDPGLALAYIDQITSGAKLLDGIPTNCIPNTCDVTTRNAYMRCEQCERRSTRLYLYGERDYVLCRRCTSSRVRAGHKLAHWEALENAA